jgi:hypothetical protein
MKRMLAAGSASIGEMDRRGRSALLVAAISGQLPTLKFLIREGGADIGEVDSYGRTCLIIAATNGQFSTVAWLLEHGGSDINEADSSGNTTWQLLEKKLILWGGQDRFIAGHALLKVMVLKGAPPIHLVARMPPYYVQVVEEGARLLVRLPTYLARRRALLDEHCPLIAPLLALVSGYEKPTITEEIWATTLDVDEETPV